MSTDEPQTSNPREHAYLQGVKDGKASIASNPTNKFFENVKRGAIQAGVPSEPPASRELAPNNPTDLDNSGLAHDRQSVRPTSHQLRESLKDQIELLLKDYLRDNLGNWHVKPTPERIEEYLRFHMPGYTREAFAVLFDTYVEKVRSGELGAKRTPNVSKTSSSKAEAAQKGSDHE